MRRRRENENEKERSKAFSAMFQCNDAVCLSMLHNGQLSRLHINQYQAGEMRLCVLKSWQKCKHRDFSHRPSLSPLG